VFEFAGYLVIARALTTGMRSMTAVKELTLKVRGFLAHALPRGIALRVQFVARLISITATQNYTDITQMDHGSATVAFDP
jgi:hypothetical protein